MFFNFRGQALIESCITLPIAMIILSSLVGLMLVMTNNYLADHWVYQSSLCLASQGLTDHCKIKLRQRLELLPLSHFNIRAFLKTDSQTFVIVNFNTMGLSAKTFQERLELPLKGSDFRK